MWSTIYFHGAVEFYRNKAWKTGGAINAIESKLYIYSSAMYNQNIAKNGGAMHLDHSYFICESNCTFIGNRAFTKGGAIHAIDSTITIGNEWFTFQNTSTSPRLLLFMNNHADKGGGICLEAKAKVRGPLNHAIRTSYNLLITQQEKEQPYMSMTRALMAMQSI